MVGDISAGIRVLQSRDGVELSDAQILERASNIVTGLMGNYRIVSLDNRPARPAPPGEQLDLLEPAPPTARA